MSVETCQVKTLPKLIRALFQEIGEFSLCRCEVAKSRELIFDMRWRSDGVKSKQYLWDIFYS